MSQASIDLGWKMDTRSRLLENFLEYGVDVSEPVLDKCEEICTLNNVDPVGLVESWMAFSVTNNLGELTLESLSQMERKEFGKKPGRDITTIKAVNRTAKGGSLTIYNASKDPVIEDNILSSYCTTPKRNRAEKRCAEHSTPENVGSKKQVAAGRSPRMAFSPASFSPSAATPSTNYSTRINGGQVVSEWGSIQVGTSWIASLSPCLRVAQISNDGQTPLSVDVRYMFEKLQAKADLLNEVAEWLGSQICKKHNLEEPGHIMSLQTNSFISVGRICCDANGRINPCSVLLEGTRVHSYGACVPVQLRAVESYALFPGQVVAVQGTNPSAQTIVAEKIFSDASLPLPSEPLKFTTDDGPLHVVVAVGPFSQTDSLTYQPLEDLVMYVQKHKPHVLILCGPFLDANHPEVLDGNVAEAFDKYFQKIIDTLMRPLAGLHTQVVLVASYRDVHHHCIYPTPPYMLPPHANLHLMPDPCFLDVNGIIFGITSTDVLMHIGREEICNPPQGRDRLGRLASHLIQQRSMYPIHPPPEDFIVDSEMWDEHTHLPVTPHVLIVPSDFRYFLKDINGCMVVNPERLCKGTAGGTFVRLQINPTPEQNGSLVNSILGQVVRI